MARGFARLHFVGELEDFTFLPTKRAQALLQARLTMIATAETSQRQK